MDKPRHYIREWRKFKDLSQEQFAERIGVTQGFVSKIERGQQNPDLAFIDAAAEVLGCTRGELLDRPPPTHGERIWQLFDKMNAAQQNQLTAIAETLFKVR